MFLASRKELFPEANRFMPSNRFAFGSNLDPSIRTDRSKG